MQTDVESTAETVTKRIDLPTLGTIFVHPYLGHTVVSAAATNANCWWTKDIYPSQDGGNAVEAAVGDARLLLMSPGLVQMVEAFLRLAEARKGLVKCMETGDEETMNRYHEAWQVALAQIERMPESMLAYFAQAVRGL
jgi:hypothetical protein